MGVLGSDPALPSRKRGGRARAAEVRLILRPVRIPSRRSHHCQQQPALPGDPGREIAMAISLYELSVPTYLQTLGAVSGFLEKGLAHCGECNVEPGQVVEHRLFEDMAPFAFQIRSVAHHSAGAMEAVKSGVFSPPGKAGPLSYSDL